MPGTCLDAGDAAELAQMLTFLPGWLTGSQKQTLAASFAAYAGHPAHNTDDLCTDCALTCTGSPSSSAKPTANSPAEPSPCPGPKQTRREPRRRIPVTRPPAFPGHGPFRACSLAHIVHSARRLARSVRHSGKLSGMGCLARCLSTLSVLGSVSPFRIDAGLRSPGRPHPKTAPCRSRRWWPRSCRPG